MSKPLKKAPAPKVAAVKDAAPDLAVECVAIADLTPDPRNARYHTPANIAAISGSLKRFGQQVPLVVDGKGIVVGGNGTLEAAKGLGWQTILIVRTKLKGKEVKALALALNRTAELAGWDDKILGPLLHELREGDFDLTEIGFDTSTLDGGLETAGESTGAEGKDGAQGGEGQQREPAHVTCPGCFNSFPVAGNRTPKVKRAK